MLTDIINLITISLLLPVFFLFTFKRNKGVLKTVTIVCVLSFIACFLKIPGFRSFRLLFFIIKERRRKIQEYSIIISNSLRRIYGNINIQDDNLLLEMSPYHRLMTHFTKHPEFDRFVQILVDDVGINKFSDWWQAWTIFLNQELQNCDNGELMKILESNIKNLQ